jgi:hypothetical protein
MPRSWQLMILSMIASLSATNADSMPAGSDKQLATVIAHCRGIINTQQKAVDAGSYERALAYRALIDALLALGAVHKVLLRVCGIRVISKQRFSCRQGADGRCLYIAGTTDDPTDCSVSVASCAGPHCRCCADWQASTSELAHAAEGDVFRLPQSVESLQHLLYTSPLIASGVWWHVAEANAALPTVSASRGRPAERADRQC